MKKSNHCPQLNSQKIHQLVWFGLVLESKRTRSIHSSVLPGADFSVHNLANYSLLLLNIELKPYNSNRKIMALFQIISADREERAQMLKCLGRSGPESCLLCMIKFTLNRELLNQIQFIMLLMIFFGKNVVDLPNLKELVGISHFFNGVTIICFLFWLGMCILLYFLQVINSFLK